MKTSILIILNYDKINKEREAVSWELNQIMMC